jgi:SET domain-containing protein 6
VCTSCGSLSECPHDLEDHVDVTASAPGADAADPENTCEMVVNAAIAPGSEIFNTYGSKLTNAELLVRYGFMLDANDNDILTWTVEEIWDAAGATLDDLRPRRWGDYPGYGDCMEILRDWENDAGWADSELVIDTERCENRNPLYMTADGILSHKLWLAIALATLWQQGTVIDVAQTRRFLTRIAWAQIQMEQGQMRVEDDGDGDEYEVRGRTCNRCLLAHRAS